MRRVDNGAAISMERAEGHVSKGSKAMKYEGKIYGKIAGKYIELEQPKSKVTPEEIRAHLSALAEWGFGRRSKNRFRIGPVEIRVTDEPNDAGIITVSVYDSAADRDLVFTLDLSGAEMIENALGE